MNRERSLKHLVSFALPPQFHFESKISICAPAQSMAKAYLDWRGRFRRGLRDCSDSNILMREHISRPHWYAPRDADAWFDICEGVPRRSVAVAGNGTCSGAPPCNWTDTFPLQFAEHSFRLRCDISLDKCLHCQMRLAWEHIDMNDNAAAGQLLLLLKGKSDTFKPGRYIYMLLCVCDSYFWTQIA